MNNKQKPLQFVITHPSELSVSDIFNYICEANAEIRRLQEERADAPTWGDWVDATMEDLDNAAVGIYELEAYSGETEICYASQDAWHTDNGDKDSELLADENLRFRRLNYEPKAAREAPVKSEEQPAKVQDDWTPITSVEQLRGLATGYYLLRGREGCEHPPFVAVKQRSNAWAYLNSEGVGSRLFDDDVMCEDSYKLIHAFEEPEKKYKVNMFGGSEELTLAEIAEQCSADDVSELAKDLLAAQARIKELEGK